MGLFDGKTKKCAICGSEAGLITGLFGYDLSDGGYLCGTCREKCGPGKTFDFKTMTIADVKAKIASAAANKKRGASEFSATHRLKVGSNRTDDFLNIDITHGWFMNAIQKDGWVYNLDDVLSFNMDVELTPLGEGESFSLGFTNYPELPRVPSGAKVTDAKLRIFFLDNELGVDVLELNMFPLFASGEGAARAAYACAHEFFEILSSYRNSLRKR